MGISKVKVCDEGSVQADVRKALIIIFSVLIILANCALMLIISKTERLRKKKFNMIIISLAVGDLFLGVFKLTKEGLGCSRIHGYHLCQALLTLEYSLRSCSIYNFILINLDRFLRIKFPLQYKDTEGKGSVKLQIVFSWLLSPLPVIPLWIPDWIENPNNGTSDRCGYPYHSKFWVWWAALTTYIIPTIVIFAFWLLIALELKRTKENNQHTDRRAKFGKDGKRLKNRTLINMTVITIAFFICWWPYAIAFLSGEFNNDGMLSRYVVLPGYLNSLINPLLYIFLNTTIRQSFHPMIRSMSMSRTMSIVSQSD